MANLGRVQLLLTLGVHVHEGYSTLCVYVCVYVYQPFSSSIKCLYMYNTLIMAIGFVLNAEYFLLTDFCEKAAFKSYSVFCLFSRHDCHFVARCNVNCAHGAPCTRLVTLLVHI